MSGMGTVIQDTNALMVAGTGSGVGKSSFVAGLGRCLRRRGINVAPFKAQNMSNNSQVPPGGGEIATSQFLQARACEVTPSTDFNPILLKPNGDGESEVVLEGRARKVMSWSEYRQRYSTLKDRVLEAYSRVASRHEVVLIEGAGSPAEPNLMDDDLVNLSLAENVDAPVVLVGDISRGGVFAWLLGTVKMLQPHQRDRIKGFVINKFRGDRTVLEEAIETLETRLGSPVLGVLPCVDDLRLPSEDSRDLKSLRRSAATEPSVNVTLIRFPRISNFTDFRKFAARREVDFTLTGADDFNGRPDLIILPGTKNTFEDLIWLKRTGLFRKLKDFYRRGTAVLGVCGGYQMMGRSIRDPDNLESEHGPIGGFGWFDFDVRYRLPKLTRRRTVQVPGTAGPCSGYEVRYGRLVDNRETPWIRSENDVLGVRKEGLRGTTLHGLFTDESACKSLLESYEEFSSTPEPGGSRSGTGTGLTDWADLVSEHCDLDRMMNIVQSSRTAGGTNHG